MRSFIIERKQSMSQLTQCEHCLFYNYDIEFDEYECLINVDQDEAAAYYEDKKPQCPYFRFGDDYTIVRKQM